MYAYILTCPAKLRVEPWTKAMGYHKGSNDSLVWFGHIQKCTSLHRRGRESHSTVTQFSLSPCPAPPRIRLPLVYYLYYVVASGERVINKKCELFKFTFGEHSHLWALET